MLNHVFVPFQSMNLFFCPTSPVTTPETLPKLSVGSSSLVTAQGPAVELLTLSVMNSKTINALYVCPILIKEPDFELSASNPVYELSFRPVSVSRPTDDFVVFYASSLGAMDALSVSCVSVFPRSQSMPWSSGPSALPRWSSAPSVSVWWSSALPWRSSALSPLHWWTPVLSAQPWRSSAPSAPPWWAPVPSAPPWWAPVPSAPPWWAPVPSALPWWAPVPSTPPWLPTLPTLPRSTATPLPRGPGPPSLPLFRLRSTALLDCIGASGSRSLGGGAMS